MQGVEFNHAGLTDDEAQQALGDVLVDAVNTFRGCEPQHDFDTFATVLRGIVLGALRDGVDPWLCPFVPVLLAALNVAPIE